MRDQPLLLLFVLFDVALVLWLALKCMWVRLPPAAPPLLSPPTVATHEAVLIDINNVRGCRHFNIDVDEIVCSLCRWATNEPAGVLAVLACDHGPKLQAFVLHAKSLDGRVVVTFAGPKLEADDTIVRGVRFCRSRGERVLAVTSDCGLRRRCLRRRCGEEVATGDEEEAPADEPSQKTERCAARRRKGARPLRGYTRVAFESSATFSSLLPDVAAARMLTDETDAVLLGSTPRSEAAAAAARWRRRERSAKRMELTADRIEQAAALFERLQLAVAVGRAWVPTGAYSAGHLQADATPAERARASAVAHAAWVNAGCPVEFPSASSVMDDQQGIIEGS